MKPHRALRITDIQLHHVVRQWLVVHGAQQHATASFSKPLFTTAVRSSPYVEGRLQATRVSSLSLIKSNNDWPRAHCAVTAWMIQCRISLGPCCDKLLVPPSLILLSLMSRACHASIQQEKLTSQEKHGSVPLTALMGSKLS